ncbi:MAG: NAD-dependent epimerase, partial [Muribaculaceae bacterium]|nr:NAD-dependent epimerase [Muribaculaceae bacterium]
HNRRSMLYIDNLCEFVKQAIDRNLSGTYHLQNREYADTVEIVRYYAKAAGHGLWCSKLFNPLVWICSFMLKPLCKMFANQYYTQELTTFDFEYQLVSFEDSLKSIRL